MAIYSLPFEEDRRLADAPDADDEAFNTIYREYKPALLAFCRSRLTDRSEAEDACQETLLRAYRSLPRFDRTQRMWPWLATIAANVCTDMRRKRLAVPLSACDRDPRAGETVDLGDTLEARDRARLVTAALGQLPDAHRRPVYLADGEGWSYADIARHEQRSVASVRTSLMRGRSTFKARARALAEERGMWPLSAVLPLARLRARYFAWRAGRDVDVSGAATPGVASFVQVAAAAMAMVGSIVPVTFAVAGASPATGALGATGSVIVADRLDVPPPKSSSEEASPAAPSSIVPPTSTKTDVDLGGNDRGVSVAVGVGARPDPDTAGWGGVWFRCTGGVVRGTACDVTDALPTAP
jgi:RNA polymerase sigma-70 factor (ECF subfamily)